MCTYAGQMTIPGDRKGHPDEDEPSERQREVCANTFERPKKTTGVGHKISTRASSMHRGNEGPQGYWAG